MRTTLRALCRRLGLAVMCGLMGSCGTSDFRTGRASHLSPEVRAQRFPMVHDAYAKLGYRVDWTGFAVMSRGGTASHFLVQDDLCFVLESGSLVTAIETSNGAMRWSEELATPLTRFVGLARQGNQLLVSSEADLYFCDTETGTVHTRQDLGNIVNTPPVLVGNIAVFGTVGSGLMGHLMVHGVSMWGYTMNGTIDQSLAVVGGAIGCVSRAGEVVFVDGATGSLIMQTRIFDGTSVPPASSDSLMFIASEDQSLYAFSPMSPSPAWRYRSDRPLRERPVFHNGTLYCTIPGLGLTAFAEDGRVMWSSPKVTGHVVGVSGGRLVVWNGSSAFLVDPARGDVRDEASVPGVRHLVADRFVDGSLYAVSDLGVVRKLVRTR